MTKRIKPGLSVILLVIANLACSTLMPPAASQALLTGRIVYQSDLGGNAHLYSVDVHGGLPRKLTNTSSNDVSPTYISATNQIGFSSDRQNGSNLYTMDLNGGKVTAVTKNKSVGVDYPAWSPDGRQIVASMSGDCASGTTCKYDIFVMNADGSNAINLTNTPTASEWVPAWSPDGQKIAFSSDRDGDSEVYVMDKDGSNVVQLTNNKGYDGTPRWSPDGKKIAFETDRDGGDWDIYTMNPDGSGPTALTSNSTSDFGEAWSPDGNWLVYVSNGDGDDEIFIIDKHGQNQSRLTTNVADDKSPVWVP